jgi:hypothetical protein
LTREEVTRLRGAEAAPAAAVAVPGVADDATPVAPQAPVPTWYLDPAASWASAVGAAPGTRLIPGAIARVHLRYDDTKAALVHDEEYEAIAVPLSNNPEDFVAVDYDDRDLLPDPPSGAVYELLPSEAGAKAWWTGLQRALADHLVRTRAVSIPANPELKLYGRVGESDAEFAARCAAAATDAADRQVATIAARFETKINALQRRVDTAAADVDRKRSERTSTVAGDLIGGLFGRRSSFGASARRASTAQSRLGAAEDKVVALEDELVALRDEAQAQIDGVRAEWDAHAAAVTTLAVSLEKSDVKVASIGLVWIPTA